MNGYVAKSGPHDGREMIPEATQAEIEEAKRLGREAGLVSSNIAGECPYGFPSAKLRHAWMDGFAESRIEAKKTRTANPSVGRGVRGR